MSKQLEKYCALREELVRVRDKYNLRGSASLKYDCPEEDAILDKMDEVWNTLTEGEKRELNNSWDSCGGSLNYLAKRISQWSVSKGWETNWRNVPEKLMLVVTELAEAMEEYRHIHEPGVAQLDGIVLGRLDDENESRCGNFRMEIADAVIRLLNLSASLGIDVEAEIAAKMEKNEKRPFKHGGKNC